VGGRTWPNSRSVAAWLVSLRAARRWKPRT
jgi:hypothetical protein